MSDPGAERSRRFPRRWVVPPGLMAHEEPFDGFHVLDEMRSGLGLLLWQATRDVDLWATSPPEVRGRLFAHGSLGRRRERITAVGAGVPVRPELEAMARVLDGRHPPRGEDLTEACQRVSRWAADSGLPRVALAFAQSASLSSPESSGPAYVVGLLARRSAQYRRAETWFRRALALARRTRDWKYYGLACIGLGNLYRQRGDYPAARSWFFKSLRVSRRHGLWQVRPMALHDLFCVAANGAHAEEAESYARRAFRAYGRRHPRLVALAHDVARFWLMKGRHEDALRVFEAVLPHISRLAERRLVTSNMARAAAGLRDRMSFAAMWSETWRLVDDYEDTESVPEALIILGQGAAALGDPDRGQMAASHALKVAIQRNESETRLAAEALLEELRGARMGPPLPRAPRPPDTGPAADSFAEDLVEALTSDFAEP